MGGRGRHSTDRLLETVYAAALDQNVWSDFCSALSDLSGKARVAMHGHDSVTGGNLGILTAGYDPEYVSRYVRYYSGINPWAARLAKTPVGIVQPSEAILPFDQMARTEWYDDWIRPQEDISTGAGVTLFADKFRFFRLSCNIRSKDREKHQATLVRRLRFLTPHLRNALAMARTLAGMPISLEIRAALELTSRAVFLLSASGRVVHSNSAAEVMMRASSYVSIVGGVLRFVDGEADKVLRACLACARYGQTELRSEFE